MDFTSLTFTDVSRNFGRRRALHRVSFRCDAGQIVALLGPNGAGKSTLLSITATLLEPSSGEVRYGEQSARRAGGALRGRIGLLGHDLYIYPELSAAENLLFFGRMYGLPEVERRIDAALAQAELSHRRDDPVGGYSRGMRQRLALERALLHEPRLVLLDEPFTGLDDAATGALRQRLAGLRNQGSIVLVTTHDLETIEGIIDRAVMLQNGRLIELPAGAGSLRERYRRAQLENRAIERPGNRAIWRSGNVTSGTGLRSADGAIAHSLDHSIARSPDFLRTVWFVTRKDLLIELRSREIVYTTLFFAVACVLVFAFGFVREGRPLEDAAAGILWIAISFSGTLALGRAFERERQSETLRALMMAPIDRPALYVGKLLGILLLLGAVEAAIVPLIALMFQASALFSYPLTMAGLLIAGTVGFASVGTLFAAMLVRARSRDVLLPVLLYPITIPVIIAGVRGTAALLQADVDLAMARAWLSMLVFFDVVFITLALWTFEPVMTE